MSASLPVVMKSKTAPAQPATGAITPVLVGPTSPLSMTPRRVASGVIRSSSAHVPQGSTAPLARTPSLQRGAMTGTPAGRTLQSLSEEAGPGLAAAGGLRPVLAAQHAPPGGTVPRMLVPKAGSLKLAAARQGSRSVVITSQGAASPLQVRGATPRTGSIPPDGLLSAQSSQPGTPQRQSLIPADALGGSMRQMAMVEELRAAQQAAQGLELQAALNAQAELQWKAKTEALEEELHAARSAAETAEGKGTAQSRAFAELATAGADADGRAQDLLSELSDAQAQLRTETTSCAQYRSQQDDEAAAQSQASRRAREAAEEEIGQAHAQADAKVAKARADLEAIRVSEQNAELLWASRYADAETVFHERQENDTSQLHDALTKSLDEAAAAAKATSEMQEASMSLESLRHEHTALQQQVTQSREAEDSARSTASDLQTSLNELQARLAGEESAASAASTEAQDLHCECNLLRSQVADLQSAAEKAAAAAEGAAAAKAAEIARLQADNNVPAAQAELLRAAQDLQEQIGQLGKDLAQERAAKEGAQQDLAQERAAKEGAQQDFVQERAAKERAHQTIQDLREEQERLQRESDAARKLQDELRTECVELRGKVATVTAYDLESGHKPIKAAGCARRRRCITRTVALGAVIAPPLAYHAACGGMGRVVEVLSQLMASRGQLG